MCPLIIHNRTNFGFVGYEACNLVRGCQCKGRNIQRHVRDFTVLYAWRRRYKDPSLWKTYTSFVMSLATDLHLVPRLRMGGALPLFYPLVFMAWTGTTTLPLLSVT